MDYYQLWSPAARDNVSITVSAEFGNPDLFITNDGRAPNQQHYTWVSRNVGSDTITIPADDPNACRMCIYVVGVLATHRDVRYTLMSQVTKRE